MSSDRGVSCALHPCLSACLPARMRARQVCTRADIHFAIKTEAQVGTEQDGAFACSKWSLEFVNPRVQVPPRCSRLR